MKKFKRNAVILTVLLFVGAAVYLNWAYDKNEEAAMIESVQERAAASLAGQTPAEASGLYYTPEAKTMTGYFDEARLSRQEARATAATALASVSEADGASQEMVDTALREISDISDLSMKEAEIETLIMAKGFEDCVVFISDGGVSVTVPAPAEGLSTASVARITDIVLEETEFCAADLRVIEIKA